MEKRRWNKREERREGRGRGRKEKKNHREERGGEERRTVREGRRGGVEDGHTSQVASIDRMPSKPTPPEHILSW